MDAFAQMLVHQVFLLQPKVSSMVDTFGSSKQFMVISVEITSSIILYAFSKHLYDACYFFG